MNKEKGDWQKELCGGRVISLVSSLAVDRRPDKAPSRVEYEPTDGQCLACVPRNVDNTRVDVRQCRDYISRAPCSGQVYTVTTAGEYLWLVDTASAA